MAKTTLLGLAGGHDPKAARAARFGEPPHGDYKSQLVKTEVVIANTGTEGLKLHFRILEGDFKGQHNFVVLWVKPTEESARRFLDTFFGIFGVDLNLDGADSTLDAERVAQRFIADPASPDGTVFVVRKKVSKNQRGGQFTDYDFTVWIWDGKRVIKSPTKDTTGNPGGVPIPSVSATPKVTVGPRPMTPNIARPSVPTPSLLDEE